MPIWFQDYEILKWVDAKLSYRTSHYPYAEEAMQLAGRRKPFPTPIKPKIRPYSD